MRCPVWSTPSTRCAWIDDRRAEPCSAGYGASRATRDLVRPECSLRCDRSITGMSLPCRATVVDRTRRRSQARVENPTGLRVLVGLSRACYDNPMQSTHRFQRRARDPRHRLQRHPTPAQWLAEVFVPFVACTACGVFIGLDISRFEHPDEASRALDSVLLASVMVLFVVIVVRRARQRKKEGRT